MRAEVLPQSRSHRLFLSHSDEDHSTDAASESPPEQNENQNANVVRKMEKYCLGWQKGKQRS